MNGNQTNALFCIEKISTHQNNKLKKKKKKTKNNIVNLPNHSFLQCKYIKEKRFVVKSNNRILS